MKTEEQQKIRQKIETNAKAYNKYLTEDHLKKLSIRDLLGLAHPNNRSNFIKELKGVRLITEYEEKEFRISLKIT